nr:ribosomal protein L7Ae/L30e/S12e/Gadd45 [Tanacetum cinerariifolium]
MARAIIGDTSRTKSYILKVSKIPGFSPVLAQIYKQMENRCMHEGRVVDQLYYKSNGIDRMFTNVRFNCLLEINEPIIPRFILDFYSQVKVQTEEYEQYNLAYLFIKRIKCARATSTANLSYGMFLTRLYRHVMEHYPYLDNGIYNVVDRVMSPLALKQTQKPRNDRGKARHSVSSRSAHHHYRSSHHDGDDDEDDGTSRAGTPSPTTYLNSLRTLNYQRYNIPTSSPQDNDLFFE